MPILAAFAVPHPPLAVPDIGRGKESGIAATIRSYRIIAERIKALAPETIVFITPHSHFYSDYIHISPGIRAGGGFAKFGAPKARYELVYDREFIKRLGVLLNEGALRAGTEGERDDVLDHGVLVPLHFINEAYSGFKSVRISVSGLGYDIHYKVGELIAEASGETGTVIVASGDLSHKLTEDGP